ncbi:hypothetical protein H0B56_17040 [Haloechinothrix sp. YIM 98757]|uniref:Uncharacterized protein n=1 Tax=Haloechinothrix aidingensis TaxID=2752311 RepID=A0A838ADQ3_9PSEU|nr:hypothetical protein [Haloechinothrix aidingensis]MBA0127258.1 hypothetical protein [Haloechinothrix aidingensis]
MVDEQRRQVHLAAGAVVNAVSMPATPLGEAVLHGLVTALQPAAITTLPTRGGRCPQWLLLTQPRHKPQAALADDLQTAGVRPIRSGEPVVLPVPGMLRPDVQWICPPSPRRGLPAYSVVLGLARRACHTHAAHSRTSGGTSVG